MARYKEPEKDYGDLRVEDFIARMEHGQAVHDALPRQEPKSQHFHPLRYRAVMDAFLANPLECDTGHLLWHANDLARELRGRSREADQAADAILKVEAFAADALLPPFNRHFSEYVARVKKPAASPLGRKPMIDLSKYKMRYTEDMVLFHGGPASQWFMRPFEGQLPIMRQVDGRRSLGRDPVVRRFRCCEEYMMAGKASIFGDVKSMQAVLDVVEKPGKLVQQQMKDIGRGVSPFDQEVWDSSCIILVAIGNYYKMTQSDDLFDFMELMGDRQFVEGSPSDVNWGVGISWQDQKIENPENWRGKNLLGKALDITARMISIHGRNADPFRIAGPVMREMASLKEASGPSRVP